MCGRSIIIIIIRIIRIRIIIVEKKRRVDTIQNSVIMETEVPK
jgi:hypothetical protein